MVLYLPLELILSAVVYRHAKDMMFQLKLKKYIKPGYEGEFLRIQMTSIAFRLNNEEENDINSNNTNAEEVRHAILRNKYQNALKAGDQELVALARPRSRGRNPKTKDADMTNNSAYLDNSEVKILGDKPMQDSIADDSKQVSTFLP